MFFDLETPDFQRDPYAVYAEIRRQGSLVTVNHPIVGKDVLFLTRYDDIVRVLKDSRFVNDRRKLPEVEDWTKKWYIPSSLKMFADSLALKDAPDHTRLRQLVHLAFTPKMIRQMEGSIAQITDDLLDAMDGKREVDLMEAFALPLPLNVIADMMGVPKSDRDKLHKWMSDNISQIPSGGRAWQFLPKIWNAMRMNGYLTRLIEDRRRHPQDDLTTALVQAEMDGDKLTETELLAMVFIIFFAGHETTVNLIGSGTLALLANPDQLALLKANPDLLDSAIEELLRYTNPVQHIATRYATEDITLDGQVIPQSSRVLIGIAAANFDETVFDAPEKLDITRDPNRHIAFGLGIHYCLGAPLARMEAKIAFTKLLERYPDIQLATDAEKLVWQGAPAFRGLKHLPVSLL